MGGHRGAIFRQLRVLDLQRRDESQVQRVPHARRPRGLVLLRAGSEDAVSVSVIGALSCVLAYPSAAQLLTKKEGAAVRRGLSGRCLVHVSNANSAEFVFRILIRNALPLQSGAHLSASSLGRIGRRFRMKSFALEGEP